MESLKELVSMSQKDLNNYSKEDLFKLADHFKINKKLSKEKLTRKIAKRIIDLNFQSKCKIMLNKIESKDLDKNREKIFKKFKKFKDSVYKMDSENLNDLFKEYDKLFFDNQISNFFKKKGYGLTFKTDGESTFTTEGICGSRICNYVITMPVHKFKEFKNPSIVAGDLCYTQLDSLQKAMEHEITHLIIFSMCEDNLSFETHDEVYESMVSGLFNHKDIRHYIF